MSEELEAERDDLEHEVASCTLAEVQVERDAARAEVQRLRAVTNDVLWLTRLAVGSSWPGEMAEAVERAAARIRSALDDPEGTTDD